MRGESILIVDDEHLIRWSLKQELTKVGFQVHEAETTKQALDFLRDHDPDLMILDQLLPDGTGIDVLHQLKNGERSLSVIMLTAIDRSDTAVKAMKLGAFDYVTKPVNIDELKLVIEKALESTRLKRQVAHLLRGQDKSYGFCGMIGSSPPMKKVYEHISKIAQSGNTTVLITGESGTGKELAARAIHFLSERKEKPLMTVNFSAVTETLVESEIFGHERGAFTDAKTQKKGIFELADGGTVFFDEIGDVPARIQVKLLRVIEQKTFTRVGGVTDITVDTRIVTATNRPLRQLVVENAFREDLYYRLNVASIELPPIRERGEDILLLAECFIHEFNSKFHKHFLTLSDEVKEMFMQYRWPGNVRELRNILERAILLNDDDVLRAHQVELPHSVHEAAHALDAKAGSSDDGISLFDLERQALVQALEKAGNNQSQAARLLKISRDTLRYRMKKYNLFHR